ncbi:MAG: bifunctional diaminohydroxyphosphoribosylaminopyrimidine deaminase/5-amino-6-(5-phosphoribosylamino)uracil reductase RibD [Burkholderiaceae bacterium]
MFSEPDHQHMSRALALAEQGLFGTTPNPRVGCVIVKDHEVVGEGWHRRAGEAHAEVLALAQAAGKARGATVYVSLEPCSHHGRTPPCVDALLAARVGRVIAAMEDPNPQVGGRGLEALRSGRVDVRCGLLEQQARELNVGFVSRMRTGRPWVRMKVAASLDGMSALRDGASQWITGASARADGQRWRARACAILTGIGTVRDDDPRLTVREVATDRQPLKVLVDSRLEVSPDARLFDTGKTLVVAAQPDAARVATLQARGAEVLVLPNAAGKVDLPALMTHLAGRGINELHVEAGGKLNGSLIREGCVDELLVYLAPALLGDAQRFAELAQVAGLGQRHELAFTGAEMFGDDVRLIARFADRPALAQADPVAVVALGPVHTRDAPA